MTRVAPTSDEVRLSNDALLKGITKTPSIDGRKPYTLIEINSGVIVGPGVYDGVNFPPYSWSWFDPALEYMIPNVGQIPFYFLLPDPSTRKNKIVGVKNPLLSGSSMSCLGWTATDPSGAVTLSNPLDLLQLSPGDSGLWISDGVTWRTYASHLNPNPFTELNAIPLASGTYSLPIGTSRVTATTATASGTNIRLPSIFFLGDNEHPFYVPGRTITIVNSTTTNIYNIQTNNTNLGVPIVLAPLETATFILTRAGNTPGWWAYVSGSVLKPHRGVYRIITATGALTAHDDFAVINNAAVNITLTLLNPLLYPGKVVTLTRDATSTGTITIQSAGTGATVQALAGTLGATTSISAHGATGQGLGIRFVAVGNSRYRF